MQLNFYTYKMWYTYSLLFHGYLLSYGLFRLYYKKYFIKYSFLLEISYVLLQLHDN
jgi:hypothetical protein